MFRTAAASRGLRRVVVQASARPYIVNAAAVEAAPAGTDAKGARMAAAIQAGRRAAVVLSARRAL